MKNVTLKGGIQDRNFFINSVSLKRSTSIEIISALFILLFLYTAINKTSDIQSTVNVIKRAPLISLFPVTMAWAIVIIEYVITILLFLPNTKKTGLYFSLGLMTVFTLFIGYMKLFIPKLPCSCGGVISQMTWNQHLIFNLIFTTLAIIGILLYRTRNKSEIETGLSNIVFT